MQKILGGIYQSSAPVGESESVLNKMNLIDDAYYFVYVELDDENGKYYPMEDVNLYQAQINGDSHSNMLYHYLDSGFVWNLGDESSGSQSGGTEEPSTDGGDKTVATRKNT